MEGEVLILDNNIELLLRGDFLERLGTRMKIGALPKIFIGEIPIGAVRNEEIKNRKRVVLREAVWIPGRLMKVVATEPLDLEESRTAGRAVVDEKKILDQIVITNFSDRTVVRGRNGVR